MLLHPQHVTLEMYHNLHDIIQKELAPHMHRLARLKKRILGLDEMRFCDLKAPLDPEFQPPTTYEKASGVILDALSILGDEYIEIMRQALTDRWVDRADNVGKSTGHSAQPLWSPSFHLGYLDRRHAERLYPRPRTRACRPLRPCRQTSEVCQYPASLYFVEAPAP